MTQFYNLSDLPHQELNSKYSLSGSLTDFLAMKKISVTHEILPPGRRASAPHRHTLKEEIVIILEGEATAFLGDRKFVLKKGDFIGFPGGTSENHWIENLGENSCSFLICSSNDSMDQVIYGG